MPVPLLIVTAAVVGRPLFMRAAFGVTATGAVSVPYNLTRLQSLLQSDPRDDEELSAVASDMFGSVITVANYPAPVSLRKLQVQYDRNGGSPLGTDDAVTTHHFVKLVAGAPSDAWVAGDFTAVETAFDTMWTALRALYTANTKLDALKWYRVVPLTSAALIADPTLFETYGPPVRAVERDVAGNDPIGNGQLPPQVAMSVTEQTSSRLHWGRFYLPAPHSADGSDQFGRIAAATMTVIADACDVFYEACYAASIAPVVYSKAKRPRPSASGAELPAHEAVAYGVTRLQIDDLFDVIRSRRWKHPLNRFGRDIAGS